MVYNRFKIILYARVLLMLLTCFAIAFITIQKQYWFTVFGLIILLILQVYALVYYLNKTNEYISRFVNYLRDENTNFQFPTWYKKPPFDQVIQSLEETARFIKNTILQKEYHYHYLQYVVNSLGVGLIVFDREGKADLVNPAAFKLLDTKRLSALKDLERIDERLESLLENLKPGEERTLKLNINSRINVLSFSATEFKISDKYFKLIAFKNIVDELDQKELESWQTLIRVLSHELMNTITPVNSLTRSLVNMYKEGNNDLKEPDLKRDTQTALELISDRVNELVFLVNRYKILSRIPVPNFSVLNMALVLDRAALLLKSEAQEHGITFTIKKPDGNFDVHADEQLITQVIINVFRNAMDAAKIALNKNIEIELKTADEHLQIHVTDYGKGITPDEMEKIFIPFFTTKENGSGVGLSLSRQIMRLHKGQIKAISTPGEFSTFIIVI